MLLLTPGPLTTAAETRRAMQVDHGSRDAAFTALVARVRGRIQAICAPADGFTCVPMQGSGTFAIEATLGTLVPRGGTAIVCANGAYGQRMARILSVSGRDARVLEGPEQAPTDLDGLAALLDATPDATHVAVVHCETTTGIQNPIEAVAALVDARGRRLIIDSMSAFGALPLHADQVPFDAVVASANKCLEGVPGVGFAVVRTAALAAAGGNAHSLSLDLHDQWQRLDKDGQWRFTPPTHALAALDTALDLFDAEGGVAGRGGRYAANHAQLVAGMRRRGFVTLLPDAVRAPIIVTFRVPSHASWHFERFYDALLAGGFAIYPGKLTQAPSFRIGCIGQVHTADLDRFFVALDAAMAHLGLPDGAP